MVLDVAPTATIVEELSRKVGHLASGAPTSAGQRQSALAIDVAGAALECAATLYSMARHAAGAAAAAAPALAAVQDLATRAATAGTRIIQPVSANAAGKAHGIAQAMASDESGAAPPSHPAAGGAAAAGTAPGGATATAARRAIGAPARRSRVVAALGVRHHVLTTEKHVAESPLSEHGGLVREMR